MDNHIEIIETIADLEYKDKSHIFSNLYSFGTLSSANVEDKLMLISLVSVVFLNMRKKNSNITPLEILLKITQEKDKKSAFYKSLEVLSLLVEELTYGCTKANTYGFKTSNEIINKIKELLSSWIPF
jgi:hypothetical protein